jgi:tripartite-type tricarboxylate transporter receptor subunit TctC
MPTKRDLLATALFAATLGLAPFVANAQAYPDRPIRLVVPYAAGGGTDAIARVIAQGMSEQLGQQLVVDNNGTAGGNVATQQAAKADPDGYTLLMANQGPMTVNPHLFKNVKIDPLTAFDPVTLIAEATLVVVVPAGSPFANFKALVDAGKQKPGGSPTARPATARPAIWRHCCWPRRRGSTWCTCPTRARAQPSPI